MKTPIKILLVEDDPDDVDLLKTAFKENAVAATFTVISQGDKVVPFLEESNQLPDVMLLDLNLPKVHGKVILTTIKTSESYRELPVIILTTSSAPADKEFCLNAGATHYFSKPTSLEDFSKIVDAVVKIVDR